MRDDNCIFCKIANGEIPSKTIYEDDKFRVILDLSPAAKGHSLILPKNHYKNILELPDETVSEVFVLAKKLGKRKTDRFTRSVSCICLERREVEKRYILKGDMFYGLIIKSGFEQQMTKMRLFCKQMRFCLRFLWGVL